MKLILCISCQDIFKLEVNQVRTCKCGKCGGQYLNYTDAEYWGEKAIPVGFVNSSLSNAIRNQPKTGNGKEFIAFVIPKECPTMRKISH